MSVRDRQRAQIILLAAEGHTQEAQSVRKPGDTCDGESLVSALRRERLTGLTDAPGRGASLRCPNGGQEKSAGDSNAPARQPGTLELPHYGANGGHFNGQRTTLVGCKRHQATPDPNL
ncbi:MAG: hypothetical protein IPP22_15480 [Nitrosomonas sp.]|nr:hypothetical protein [Nitrosomonas sp.]